jgi:pyrimidine 5'-nucleotidase
MEQLLGEIHSREAKAAVFDLDGTLYRSGGMEYQIVPNIRALAAKMLGLSPEQTKTVLSRYKEAYGHPVKGLQIHHDIDAHAFVETVYRNLDLSGIAPYDGLPSTMLRLKKGLRIYVMTNSGRVHGRAVLDRLGLTEAVDDLVAFEDTDFILKPDRRAYVALRARTGVKYRELVYFDDSVRNIQTASEIGMAAILVSNRMTPPPLFWEMHLRIRHEAPEYGVGSTHDLVRTLEGIASGLGL